MTIITSAGEVIGRLTSEDESSIVLENPRSMLITENGAGFAPGISMTGEDNPKEISLNKSHIIFMTKTKEVVAKAWIQQTSGIVV